MNSDPYVEFLDATDDGNKRENHGLPYGQQQHITKTWNSNMDKYISYVFCVSAARAILWREKRYVDEHLENNRSIFSPSLSLSTSLIEKGAIRNILNV